MHAPRHMIQIKIWTSLRLDLIFLYGPLARNFGVFSVYSVVRKFEKIYYWLDRKFEAWVNLEFSRFANLILPSCKFSAGTKFSLQESVPVLQVLQVPVFISFSYMYSVVILY